MKSNLKAKYIQYLSQKKQDEGFTLIELLVVIIILGILSAIALPSFLNQGNKAKEAEAILNVGAINRGQQIYRVDPANTTFASAISSLEVGVGTETSNFRFSLAGVGNTSAIILANPKDAVAVKGVAGRVDLIAATGVINEIICKNDAPGDAKNPISGIQCDIGSKPVN
jgi:type IV pilus assembly protein PilA